MTNRPELPVIASCDACGACCRVVTAPPFRHDFGGAGDERWERLRRERPDLLDALLAHEKSRRAAGEPSYGTPCHWLDSATGRCRNYDWRPTECRAFEMGGRDCADARRRAAIA